MKDELKEHKTGATRNLQGMATVHVRRTARSDSLGEERDGTVRNHRDRVLSGPHHCGRGGTEMEGREGARFRPRQVSQIKKIL